MSKGLKILIVEDEALIAEMISEILQKAGFKSISIAGSVTEAINMIEANPPGLVLTDINFGVEKTGLNLGHSLYTKYKIPFIYITSHSTEGIIEKAKHTRPNGFIIKPFRNDDILVAIELALFNSNDKEEQIVEEIVVKVGRSVVRLSCDKIMWIESESNYTSIHLSDQVRKVVRISLSEIQDQLPADIFHRIHKSYIVNKKYISEIKANVVIIDSKELPIGRTYQSIVNKKLLA